MSRAYDSTGRSRQAWIAFEGAGSFVARRVLCLAVALSLAGCDLHGSDNHAHAVKGKTVPQNLRIRSLADAPTAENYVAPGIKGLDAQLRARATRTRSGACPSTVKFHTPKAKLARYTPYKSPTTPPDPVFPGRCLMGPLTTSRRSFRTPREWRPAATASRRRISPITRRTTTVSS